MDTNTVNTRSVSCWWCLYISSNTSATFEGEFMENLSNTEAELKKSFACIKKHVITIEQAPGNVL